MAQHTFNAWQLHQFSGGFGSATDTTGSGSVGNTTLSLTATQISFTIDDDDPNLEDSSFGEGGASIQTLVNSITVNGVTYPAGATVQLEYVANVDDGSEMLVIRIGTTVEDPPNAVAGNNVLVIYPEGVPGTTYTISSISDEQGRAYDAICFGRGTQILTMNGSCAVEDIKIGDILPNKTNETVTVRWVGKMALSEAVLVANPNLRPIIISKGALGENRPSADLTVSPQHRILIDDWRAEMMFGFSEFLTPAKALINDGTIRSASPLGGVEYFHIMFDTHEIISANGQWTESFFTGKQAISALDDDARAELIELFPELNSDSFEQDMEIAAPNLKPFEFQVLREL